MHVGVTINPRVTVWVTVSLDVKNPEKIEGKGIMRCNGTCYSWVKDQTKLVTTDAKPKLNVFFRQVQNKSVTRRANPK